MTLQAEEFISAGGPVGAASEVRPLTYESCFAAGLTAQQASRLLGVTAAAAYWWARRSGVTWVRAALPVAAETAPSWEVLHGEGFCLMDAVAIRGERLLAGWKWAENRGLVWPEFSPVPAPRDVPGPVTWPQTYQRGMTLEQAVIASGRQRQDGQKWAKRAGVSWPLDPERAAKAAARFDAADRATVLPGEDLLTGEVDAMRCLRLWQSALAENMLVASGARASDTPCEVRRTQAWVGSSDFRTVASLAGYDPQYCAERAAGVGARAASMLAEVDVVPAKKGRRAARPAKRGGAFLFNRGARS